jgi:cellulose synthase/poly-beta-1,6-N-acetylglucosamine synthase-like glycosyltransferase
VIPALFTLLAALVLAVYVGYPAWLWWLARRVRATEPEPGFEPSATVLIPAHNEEAVIEQKLRNFLALDYPPEKLRALVVSDGSSDRTCEIVRELTAALPERDRGRIRLLEGKQRSGKTRALSAAAPQVETDLILFTDANNMWRPDAVRKLVRHFSDARVGLVCGRLHYLPPDGSERDEEGLYWRYEDAIKRWEGAIGSLLVTNGSIYGIRRELFEPLPGPVADDFVVPLRIGAQGFRLLYERDAVGEERLPADAREDFRSKARIVTQGFEAAWSCRSTLLASGPFRMTQYLLHKILRWCMGLVLIALGVVSALGATEYPLIGIAFGLQGVFYLLAAVGWRLRDERRVSPVLRVPAYFCLVNAAATAGFVMFLRGEQRATWEKSHSTR